MKAKVKNDTLFKLQPVLSSELADSEKQVVLEGTEYEIKFYTEAANDHLRLEFATPPLAKRQSLTWYAHKANIDFVDADVAVMVQQDTVFKRLPVLASELSDSEKAFVKAGSRYALQSYAPAPNNYSKLTLAESLGSYGSFDVWYANSKDIQIAGQRITLTVISDTLLKAKPLLASQLSSSEKRFVPKFTRFALQSYSEVEGNYLKMTLAGSTFGQDDRLTWYAFAPDVEIEGTVAYDRPEDNNVAGQAQFSDRGQPLNLPGFIGTHYTYDPIIAGGYFTWAQATHDGTRVPASAEVVYGIIRIAEVMEEIRGLFDNRAIAVTSWYRDPATNLRVGGTAMSRHIYGDAVNFTVEDYPPNEVYAKLDPWWGSRGGLASSTQFTHIDARGYKARWDYGF